MLKGMDGIKLGEINEHGIPKQRRFIFIEGPGTNKKSPIQYRSIHSISRILSYANNLDYLKNWFETF